MKSTATHDVVIVGAGIAGCPLAFTLGKQGRKVLLIERDLTEPDRIVGELLQPSGLNRLKEMGLGDTVKGIDAQTVKGYGLLYNGDKTNFEYPIDSETGKPAVGVSFHHGRFIQKLRAAATSAPNVTVVQGTVTDLVRDDSPEGRVLGVEYRVSPESEPVKAYASVTVVADGCHSRFRKLLSAEEDEDVRIDVDSHFVGMIINDVTMDYDKMGNVFLIKPSPVLMYQIGSNDTRVLIDVAGKKLRPKAEIIEYCRDTVAPQLTDAVRPAFLRALEGGDIRSMPNQYMSARKITTPGIVVVGDASNMRHPLTGGGMTVAFTDVKLLTDMWAELPDLADWDAVELTRNRLFEARKEKVSAINVLSSALYSVFSVPQPDFEKLRSACFYYLKAGGWFLAGPVGLLSGLTPDPLLLVTHFFAVAVYGTYLTCSPFPTPSRFITSIKMIKEAADIMIPLLIRDKVTFLAPLGRLWYGSCTATPQQA